MKKFVLYMLMTFTCINACLAKPHFSVGVHKTLKEFQDSKGKEDEKPFSPFIGWGHHFNLFQSRFGFSPQIGYIHTKQTANDSFGKQKIHTIFLNWDFLYVPTFSNQLAFRFGVGNFIKRISGEGGTVEIPNGSGTDQALRPDKTVNSYSSTLNLGTDFNFNMNPLGWVNDLGLRFELFTFRPFSKENRNYAFNFGILIYH